MTAPERVDNYALDDTLAGRLTQAAAVGILTALPDYFTSRLGLTLAYAAGFSSFAALVAYTNAESEEENLDVHDAPEVNPLVFVGLLAAGVGISAASLALGPRLAARLAARGIGKPWTVMGLTGAVLTFVLSELEARGLDKAATV